MRISGGKYLNRRLTCSPGIIRPAMEKMRESMFSILSSYLDGSSFLDLFSGSGIVAAEAASRGARDVIAVEKDIRKKTYIENNLSFLEENCRIYIMDVNKFLAVFSKTFKFDIIYLDPPFNFKHKIDLLTRVFKSPMLNDNAIVVIHYPEEEDSTFQNEYLPFKLFDKREYGRSNLRFYKGTKDA